MEPVLRGRVEYLPTYQAMQAFTAARSAATADELWICEHPPVYTQGLAGRAEHVRDAGAVPVIATDRGGQVTYHGPGQVVAYPLIDLRRAGYFVKEYVHRIEEAVIRTLEHYGVTGHRVRGAPGIYVRLDDPFSHAILPPPQPSPKGGGSNASPPPALAAGGAFLTPPAGADSSFPPPPPGEGWGGGTDPRFDGLGKIAALGIKVSRHCAYHGVALNVAMDLQPFTRIDPCGYASLKTVDLSTIGVSTTWNEAAQVLGRKLTTWLAP
ncbi:MAG: lipoate-protein ligase [Ramlibacter sp.]|nr:lipoate-protein ligase [Ramlibacter sp.]